ncbi:MAG: pseudouridine synthase [Fluviicola sp.]|nr:pseudouridine synthase [Fluviicola sp.]
MEIPVLFEDEVCLVVNKPNNLLVHHSHFARNIETPSLVELVRGLGYESAVPVHRLDHKTSGALIFVKSNEYASDFQQLFDSKAIQKTYAALLRGHIAESGIIDSPVKNERGNYKEALTHYRCLQHFELKMAVEPYPTSRYSLVEFTPETGRTHQLRIHANKISHPIIGDPKHGNRHHNHAFQEQLQLPDLFLHAERLEFVHPYTQELVKISADFPDFWEMFFERVRMIQIG